MVFCKIYTPEFVGTFENMLLFEKGAGLIKTSFWRKFISKLGLCLGKELIEFVRQQRQRVFNDIKEVIHKKQLSNAGDSDITVILNGTAAQTYTGTINSNGGDGEAGGYNQALSDELTNAVEFPQGITIFGRWTNVSLQANLDNGIICYYGQ